MGVGVYFSFDELYIHGMFGISSTAFWVWIKVRELKRSLISSIGKIDLKYVPVINIKNRNKAYMVLKTPPTPHYAQYPKLK